MLVLRRVQRLPTIVRALSLEYDLPSRLDHGVAAAAVLDALLQLVGLLCVLLLRLVVDRRPREVDPLEHLNVLLNLLGLLFPPHDVVQRTVVPGRGAGCEAAAALHAALLGQVLGGRGEELSRGRTCRRVVLQLMQHVAVHLFLQVVLVDLDIADIDQPLPSTLRVLRDAFDAPEAAAEWALASGAAPVAAAHGGRASQLPQDQVIVRLLFTYLVHLAAETRARSRRPGLLLALVLRLPPLVVLFED